jgi:pyocin large subunit-like protein
MSQPDSYNVAHDIEVKRVEGSRQSAARAAGVSQATVVTAEIAYYRAVLAATRILGRNQGTAIHALRDLGVSDP